MSVLHAVVRLRDRRAYAVSESSMYDEPTLVRHWWRIDVMPEVVKEGSEVAFTLYGSVRLETNSAFRTHVEVPFDRSAKAEIVEREPIPPPRTRCETRYRYGRWERYTKSQGWEVSR